MKVEPLKINPMDLSGRTILVTGASSGIGRETAVLLSQLNARLILTARNEDRLTATLSTLHNDGHWAQPFDLSRTEEIPKWVKGVAAQAGPLFAIVHAAGKQAATPIRFVTEERVDDLVRTNLYSAIMLARGFSQKNCYVPGGSLVFISSITAFAAKPAISVYAATKSALLGMTKSLALELAPLQIRVNCVAPGFVETEMLEDVRSVLTDEQVDELRSSHPFGFGTPRDVANTIAFLLAETGRWMTGSTLVLDGGYSAQ